VLIGSGKYTGKIGEWLAAQGHDVRVVAAPRHYPAGGWRRDTLLALTGASVWRAGTEIWRAPYGYRPDLRGSSAWCTREALRQAANLWCCAKAYGGLTCVQPR